MGGCGVCACSLWKAAWLESRINSAVTGFCRWAYETNTMTSKETDKSKRGTLLMSLVILEGRRVTTRNWAHQSKKTSMWVLRRNTQTWLQVLWWNCFFPLCVSQLIVSLHLNYLQPLISFIQSSLLFTLRETGACVIRFVILHISLILLVFCKFTSF